MKLQITNELNYNKTIKIGAANLIFNKLKSNFTYKFYKDFFEFNFFENPKSEYNAKVNFKPFYSNVIGDVY